jgi:hypothetical protein
MFLKNEALLINGIFCHHHRGSKYTPCHEIHLDQFYTVLDIASVSANGRIIVGVATEAVVLLVIVVVVSGEPTLAVLSTEATTTTEVGLATVESMSDVSKKSLSTGTSTISATLLLLC